VIGKVDRVVGSHFKLGPAFKLSLADAGVDGVEHFDLDIETEGGPEITLLGSDFLDELIAATILGEVDLGGGDVFL